MLFICFLKNSFDKKAPKTFGNEAKSEIGLFAVCENYITDLITQARLIYLQFRKKVELVLIYYLGQFYRLSLINESTKLLVFHLMIKAEN